MVSSPTARLALLVLVAAGALSIGGRFLVRAVVGPPPSPAPAGDATAPGEPVPPGLGAPADPAATWEDRYFPFLGYEPELAADLAPGGPQVPSEGPEMVHIAGGDVALGDTAIPGARPVYPMRVDGFWIDRTEVTNAAYQRFVAAGAGRAPTSSESWALPYAWNGGAPPAGLERHPVVLVTREDAAAYCRFVDKRLPTEAEWERVARGPAGLRYPWGNRWDSTRTNVVSRRSGPLRTLEDWRRFVAAYASAGVETWPAGSARGDASHEGALDLAGNVSEWVDGAFGPYPGADPTERPGFQEALVVARGGAWGNRDYSAPAASRYPYPPGHRDIMIGFRCARSGP